VNMMLGDAQPPLGCTSVAGGNAAVRGKGGLGQSRCIHQHNDEMSAACPAQCMYITQLSRLPGKHTSVHSPRHTLCAASRAAAAAAWNAASAARCCRVSLLLLVQARQFCCCSSSRGTRAPFASPNKSKGPNLCEADSRQLHTHTTQTLGTWHAGHTCARKCTSSCWHSSMHRPYMLYHSPHVCCVAGIVVLPVSAPDGNKIRVTLSHPKSPPCRQQLLQAVHLWIIVASVTKHKAHRVLQDIQTKLHTLDTMCSLTQRNGNLHIRCACHRHSKDGTAQHRAAPHTKKHDSSAHTAQCCATRGTKGHLLSTDKLRCRTLQTGLYPQLQPSCRQGSPHHHTG
jgi:hypothetical protein